MLDRIIVVLTIIAVYYLITQTTEEGYYYGPTYNPVRGYFRDYFPRVGTGISSYGLVHTPISSPYPSAFTLPRDDFSGFPYQDASNYSAGFGPYRLPYLNNRLLFWNKVAGQYPSGRIPNAVPFYRVPINTF